MLNLHHIQPLRQLLAAFAPACETPASSAPADPFAMPTAAVDALPGCGWFDSSHELQHGLSVREHAGTATLAGELPLGDWLDLHLAGWSPALPA